MRSPTTAGGRTKAALLSAALVGIFRQESVSAEDVRELVSRNQQSHREVRDLLAEGQKVEETCRAALHK